MQLNTEGGTTVIYGATSIDNQLNVEQGLNIANINGTYQLVVDDQGNTTINSQTTTINSSTTNITNNLTVGGDSYLKNLNLDEGINAAKAADGSYAFIVDQQGNIDTQGNAHIGGETLIEGATTINDRLSVSGGFSAANDNFIIDALGNTTLNGILTLNNGLDISSGGARVSGGIEATSGDINIANGDLVAMLNGETYRLSEMAGDIADNADNIATLTSRVDVCIAEDGNIRSSCIPAPTTVVIEPEVPDGYEYDYNQQLCNMAGLNTEIKGWYDSHLNRTFDCAGLQWWSSRSSYTLAGFIQAAFENDENVTCPLGQENTGSSCVAIQCPTGHSLSGNSCVLLSGYEYDEYGVACDMTGINNTIKNWYPSYLNRSFDCPGLQWWSSQPSYTLNGFIQAAFENSEDVTCPSGQENTGSSCIDIPPPIQCPTGTTASGNNCVLLPGYEYDHYGVACNMAGTNSTIKGWYDAYLGRTFDCGGLHWWSSQPSYSLAGFLQAAEENGEI